MEAGTSSQESVEARRWFVPVVLGLITLVGLIIRWHLFERSLLGDELSTLWIVQSHSLTGTVDVVASNAEITPPLSFILSWLSTRLGDSPELVRLPSMIAGVASIPLLYLLGKWTVSQRAGLVAAAVFTLSPFMSYMASNGRGYAVMILFLIGSTLAMLRGVETGRIGWWVAYALLSCAAMYSHYTAAFVLLGQLVWLLVFHPPARIAALVANAGAAVLFLPWLPSVLEDMDSPTTRIMEALQGSGVEAKWNGVEQWAVGHPVQPPEVIPGDLGLLLVGAGLAVAVVSLAFLAPARARLKQTPIRAGFWLLVALAVSTPLLELLLIPFGTDLLGARNMTASWYGFAALAGVLVALPGGVAALVSGTLLIGGFGVGAAKLWGSEGKLVAFEETAAAIDRQARPGDVVLDRFVSSDTPTPLTPLRAYLETDLPYFALGLPDGLPPFLPGNPPTPDPDAELRNAFAEAGENRVFLRVITGTEVREAKPGEQAKVDQEGTESSVVLPPGARIVGSEEFPAVRGSTLYVVDPG